MSEAIYQEYVRLLRDNGIFVAQPEVAGVEN